MRKLKNEELGRLSVSHFKASSKIPVSIVLDNIRSLNNVGSVFRTSDAFRVEEILLCGITGTPPHREIHKTALGATESVSWQYFDTTLEALEYLSEKNIALVAIEQVESSLSLEQFTPKSSSSYAFIFGNEVKGVGEEVLPHVDACIEIPQFGTKHSFNISISVGIVLWHFYMKSMG